MTTYDDEPRAKTATELQDELFEHLVFMVKYWVEVKDNYKEAKFQPFMERISGYVHSFCVVFAGNAGGFNASIDAYASTSEKAVDAAISEGKNYFPLPDTAEDINDGSWQYRTIPYWESLPDATELDANGSREWTAEEIRIMLFNEISLLAEKWAARTYLNEYDALGGFVRDVFVLFEQGSETFPATIKLVFRGMQENIDYWIEEGENYVPLETDVDTAERTALQAWDHWWVKSRPKLQAR